MRVLRSKLSVGMELESPAVDRDRRMLIGEGAVLTDRLIEVLETAEIPILCVTETPFAAHRTCGDLPTLSKQQEQQIHSRFRHADLEGDFAGAVFGECINHIGESMAEDAGGDA